MLKLVQRIYLVLLVFSPLAFGSVELWSRTIMEGLSFLALFLFFVDLTINKREFFHVPGIVPLLLLPTYILLQFLPLPDFFVRIISPETYGLYHDTIGLLEPVNGMPLSINQKESLSEFFRYGAYASFYILSVQLLSRKQFFKKTLNTVIVFVSLLAFLAILQHFTADGKIYWFKELSRGTPFGPYVNRNHFAGLVGMIFPLVLAMFLYHKPRVNYSGLRTRLAEFFSYRTVNTYFLLGAGLVLLGVSVFLSLSRGGIISLCLATCVFGVLMARQGVDRGRSFMILAVFSFVLLSVGWFGWDPIFERFNRIRNPAGEITESRIPRWKDSLEITRDYPVTGTGFGTFADAYKGYQISEAGAVVAHAHNDYIELAIEGGLIAAGLASWFLISILGTYRHFLRRRDSYCIYLYLGGLAGLSFILFHSIVDFNLHIGANGLYFFLICAICVSAAHTRIRSGPGNTYLSPYDSADSILVKLSGLLIAAMLVLSLGFNACGFIADLNFKAMLNIMQKEELAEPEYKQIRNLATRMIKYDPFNSLYRVIYSNAEKSLGNEAAAFESYKKAIRLNPASGVYLQGLADLVSNWGDKITANRLYEASIQRDVSSSQRFATYSFWLLENGETRKGIETMQNAISLSPRRTRRYLELLIEEKLLETVNLIRVLPGRVEPHIIFAEYLAEKEKFDQADAVYTRALSYLDKEEEIRPDFFIRIYKHYMKQKAFEEALGVMRKGIICLPNNARLRMTIASLYEKLGINYRAIEEYKKALVLDSKNKQAKRKLAKLQS
ncbi:MAG: O-antigen ligase family protein [Pseudomonadota bacterium]